MTWFEEPVSSDDLDGLRLLRDRAPAGMEIAAGEYGYDLPYFRRMLEAGAVDVLQADATRCGGITGFLQVGAPLRGVGRCRSRPTAPRRCTCTRACALAELPPPRVLPRPRPDRAHALRRRARRRSTARCAPTCRAPASAWSSSARTPRVTPSEPSRSTGQEKDDGHRIDDRDHRRSSGTAAEVTGSALRRRLGASRPTCAARSAARSGSTPAAAPSTRPTARTTARCPIGVVDPRDRRRRDRDGRGLPRARRAAALARRRHEPDRRLLQRRRRHGLVQVPQQGPRDRPRRRSWPGSSRARCSTSSARQAEQHDLTFAPDPSTHTHNTLGGMIGNNSCGVHSLMGLGTGPDLRPGPRARDPALRRHADDRRRHDARRSWSGSSATAAARARSTRKLKALRDRYADEIRRRYPEEPAPPRLGLQPRRPAARERASTSPGPSSGTEGTCVTILEASLHLVHSPAVKSLLVLGYPTSTRPATTSPEILEFKPIGLEGIDDVLVRDMKKKGIHPKDITLLPEGGGWLLVEFGGESKDESDDKARALMDRLKKAKNPPSMKLFDDEAEEEHLWKVRESGLGATARIPGETDAWEGWEDSAVPPDQRRPLPPRPPQAASTSTATTARSTATSARAASTPGSTST